MCIRDSSRSWRGLRIWLPFMLHGVRAFREALAEKRELALWLEREIASEADIETTGPPELSLFAFRARSPGDTLDEENARNRQLLARINTPRRIYLTATTVAGKFWIRICILHMRTDRSRAEETLAIIREALRTAG